MKATLNHHLFTASVFDSGELDLLTSVVHQFSEPGRYRVAIRRKGVIVGDATFEVAEGGPMQLSIDLSALPTSVHTDKCPCDAKAIPTVSPKGFVLFHGSRGAGGYSAIVSREAEEAKPVFDSEKLGPGDLFVLSLLEPTRYSMTNQLGSAKGVITVSFDTDMAKQLKELQAKTHSIDVSKDAFKPDRVSVVSTQGIVFRVADRARIVVSRLEPFDAKRAPREPRRVTRLRLPDAI